MAPPTDREPRAPETMEALIRQLLVTRKAVKLYPPASDIPRQNAERFIDLLRDVFKVEPVVRFGITKDGFLYGPLQVLPGQPAFAEFAREFYRMHVSDIRFHAGVSAKEVTAFLGILDEEPDEVDAAGGYATRLWDKHVDGITVSESVTRIVDAAPQKSDEEDRPPEEVWPPPRERVDELIALFRTLGRGDRTLVRFLEQPRLVARYLVESLTEWETTSRATRLLADRIGELARVAASELADDQPALFRSIAEAIMGLDPLTRRDLLAQRLIVDARIDDAIAEVVRQLDLTDLCAALVAGRVDGPVAQEGLARALRALALISMRDREEVIQSARAAFSDAGLAPDEVDGIIERAMPSKLEVSGKPSRRAADRQDDVLRIIDLAGSSYQALEEDPALVKLREEAGRGVSDADVVGSLVTLLTLERRPEMFASLLSLVEDSIALLFEWGEFGVAADALEALFALAEDATLDSAQRARVDELIASLADREHLQRISSRMRLFESTSAEHEACRRVLEVLGTRTIEPLLEVLADEQDMSARKALIELISSMAGRHIERLGHHVSDPRWYFVRNVVYILCVTRDPAALGALARVLHHPDARVRR